MWLARPRRGVRMGRCDRRGNDCCSAARAPAHCFDVARNGRLLRWCSTLAEFATATGQIHA